MNRGLLWEPGLPAMVVNDNASFMDARVALESIASKLAPTEGVLTASADQRKPHISQRKTSNPCAHLVQSQPL